MADFTLAANNCPISAGISSRETHSLRPLRASNGPAWTRPALKILTILLFMVAFVSRDTAIERRNLFVMISSSLSALFDFQIIKKIDAFRFHLAVTKELISELRNCNPFCVMLGVHSRCVPFTMLLPTSKREKKKMFHFCLITCLINRLEIVVNLWVV